MSEVEEKQKVSQTGVLSELSLGTANGYFPALHFCWISAPISDISPSNYMTM